jgi:hypothetical protein
LQTEAKADMTASPVLVARAFVLLLGVCCIGILRCVLASMSRFGSDACLMQTGVLGSRCCARSTFCGPESGFVHRKLRAVHLRLHWCLFNQRVAYDHKGAAKTSDLCGVARRNHLGDRSPGHKPFIARHTAPSGRTQHQR